MKKKATRIGQNDFQARGLKSRIRHFSLYLLPLTLSTPVVDAAVQSISKEEYKEYSADNIYWEVGVRCAGVDQIRVLQQQGTGEAWCAKDAPSICNIIKEAAADMACEPAYQLEADQIKAQRQAEALAEAQQEAESAAKVLASSAPPPKPEPVIILPAKEPTPVREPAASPYFKSKASVQANGNSSRPAGSQRISTKPLAQQSPSEQLTTMQALQNQIDLEEKRIQLELQRLDLRTRALELKKQELELRVNGAN